MSDYTFDSIDTQLGTLSMKIVVEDSLSDEYSYSEKLLQDLTLNYEMESRLGYFSIGDIGLQFTDDDGNIEGNILDPALQNDYDIRFQLYDGSYTYFDGFILAKTTEIDPYAKTIKFNAVDYVIYKFHQHKMDELDTSTVQNYLYRYYQEIMEQFGDNKVRLYQGWPNWDDGASTSTFDDLRSSDILNAYGPEPLSTFMLEMCQALGGVFFGYRDTYYFNFRNHYLSTLSPTRLEKPKILLRRPDALDGIFYQGKILGIISKGNLNSKNVYELRAFENANIQGVGDSGITLGDTIVQYAFDNVYDPLFIDKTKRMHREMVEEFVHPGMRIQIGSDYYYVVVARNHLNKFQTELELMLR